MTKKLVVILLLISLCISLCACRLNTDGAAGVDDESKNAVPLTPEEIKISGTQEISLCRTGTFNIELNVFSVVLADSAANTTDSPLPAINSISVISNRKYRRFCLRLEAQNYEVDLLLRS